MKTYTLTQVGYDEVRDALIMAEKLVAMAGNVDNALVQKFVAARNAVETAVIDAEKIRVDAFLAELMSAAGESEHRFALQALGATMSFAGKEVGLHRMHSYSFEVFEGRTSAREVELKMRVYLSTEEAAALVAPARRGGCAVFNIGPVTFRLRGYSSVDLETWGNQHIIFSQDPGEEEMDPIDIEAELAQGH